MFHAYNLQEYQGVSQSSFQLLLMYIIEWYQVLEGEGLGQVY